MRSSFVFFFVLLISGLAFIQLTTNSTSVNWPAFQRGLIDTVTFSEPEKKARTSSIFFGGDVLLARDVERLMEVYGTDYPYEELSNLWASSSAVVVNFESTASNTHEPTPDLTTSFSSPLWSLEGLRDAGVTHVSLANNHALDKGERAYIETIENIEEGDITVFGHPKVVDATTSVSSLQLGDKIISLLGLHDIEGNISRDDISVVIEEISTQSDHQIAFVHWGQEYKETHSLAQKNLAEFLIDSGIDLVIGHHPHVVQDIQLYKDKIIVFSLGNLIFDQYFSQAVQEGLMLELKQSDVMISLNLHPVTSIGSRIQPRPMATRERELWLTNLSKNSALELTGAIAAGVIRLDENLAISPRLP